jgi:hypothetical protein
MRQVAIAGMFLMGFMLYAYGGRGGDSTLTSGSVALFATDEMSSHKQVIATIKKVQFIKQGSNGIACDVLTTPVGIDISNLSSTLQLINAADCPSNIYNRILIAFDKSITLMNRDNKTETCSLASYKDNLNNSNSLQCDGSACSLDIYEPVNIFANQNSRFALDFDLKEFEVSNSSSANCSVTLKVSALNDFQFDFKKSIGYKEGVSGLILNLNTNAKTFNILKGNKTFTVDYSRILQENIDFLLQFAFTNNLSVNIESSDLDLKQNRCIASTIFIKIYGTVLDLNSKDYTFTITTQNNKIIPIDYTNAHIDDHVGGGLSNNIIVAAKLKTYDGKTYSACLVEVTNMETED